MEEKKLLLETAVTSVRFSGTASAWHRTAERAVEDKIVRFRGCTEKDAGVRVREEWKVEREDVKVDESWEAMVVTGEGSERKEEMDEDEGEIERERNDNRARRVRV